MGGASDSLDDRLRETLIYFADFDAFRPPPPKVGGKTLRGLQERGLLEIEGTRGKLTDVGRCVAEYLLENPVRPRSHAWERKPRRPEPAAPKAAVTPRSRTSQNQIVAAYEVSRSYCRVGAQYGISPQQVRRLVIRKRRS